MDQLSNFEELVLHFAKTIIANPNYTFNQEDMAQFVEFGVYSKNMKYKISMQEAVRFADAFLEIRSELKEATKLKNMG